MNQFQEFLIKVYNFIFRKNRKVQWPDKSLGEFNKTMEDFSKRIDSFPYKSDLAGGLIDYVARPDEFFDETRTYGRDCDDWARIWSIWGSLHGYKATEWIICDPRKMFSTMHVFTTLEKEGKYYLANYGYRGPFSTEKDALKDLNRVPSYSGDVIIIKSKEILPKESPLKEIG